MGEGATLDSGDLAGRRARAGQPDRHPDDHLARAVQARRASAATATSIAFSGVERAARCGSLDERPLPLQVDGDYIGEVDEARFAVVPGGILGRLLSGRRGSCADA